MPRPALASSTPQPLAARERLLLASRPAAAAPLRYDRSADALALGSAAMAFVSAAYFPVQLFLLGPVSLGVLHVACDVRHLVLRRELQRWWRNVVWIGCASLLGVRLLDRVHGSARTEQVETLIVAAWALAAVGAAQRRGGPAQRRAGLAVATVVAAAAAALAWPRAARSILLHAHNLVALAAWGLLFRSRAKPVLSYAALILGAAALLASGALYRVALGPGAAWSGTHVLQVADWVAPGLRTDYAIGVTSAFVFLQAIHYVIWLALIPLDEAASRSQRASRAGWRSWHADFGSLGLVACALVAAAFLIGACVQLQRSRAVYLSLANFHTYLELVMLLYFWVQGGLDREPARGQHPAMRGT